MKRTSNRDKYDITVYAVEEQIFATSEKPVGVRLVEYKARRTEQMYLVLNPGSEPQYDREFRVRHEVVEDGKRVAAFDWRALGVGLTPALAIARAIELEDEMLRRAERAVVQARLRGDRNLAQLGALRREHNA